MKVTIRELFLVVTLVAMALGWFISWDAYRVDYNGHLNEVRGAQLREEQLRVAIQGEGYTAEWDEDARTYKLTKLD